MIRTNDFLESVNLPKINHRKTNHLEREIKNMEEEISPTIPLHRFIAVAKVKSSLMTHQ